MLRDHSYVRIRPSNTRDDPVEQVFLARLSPGVCRFRLLGQAHYPSDSLIDQPTRIDHVHEVALVAVTPEDSRERIVGVGRYRTDQDGLHCEQRAHAMRILLAVDGSPVATRAARFVARLSSRLKEIPEVVLLHADEPLLKSVAIELGVQGVAKYHADNSKFALKAAKAVLNRAVVAYDEESLVGNPAETIVKFAKSARCDLVVMGSHGRSAFKSLFLGSVTTKVLAHSPVPVTIIR